MILGRGNHGVHVKGSLRLNNPQPEISKCDEFVAEVPFYCYCCYFCHILMQQEFTLECYP